MKNYLEFVSKGRRLGILFAAVLVLLVLVFPALPVGGEMLDVRTGYTDADVVAAMEGYGEQGRRVYAWSSALLDTLLPVLYVSLLAGLLYRLRPSAATWRLAFLPVAAGVLDLCENVLVIVMLNRFPDVSASLATTASFFTSVKWYAMWLSMVLVLVFAVVAAIRRLRGAPAGAS